MSQDASFFMQLSAFLFLVVCALSTWLAIVIWDNNKVLEELTGTLHLQNKKIRDLKRQTQHDFAARSEHDKKIIKELTASAKVDAWIIGKLRSQLKSSALESGIHEDVISFEDSNLTIGTHALGLP